MAVKKRGRVWVADFWIGGNGQRVRRKAPTQELAKAFEREVKAREFVVNSCISSTAKTGQTDLWPCWLGCRDRESALSSA